MKKLLILLLLVCVLKTSIAQKDAASTEAYIRAARNESNAAIAKKDINGVAKFWKDDYVEISSDGSLISGREAVIADWKKMYEKDPSVRFERKFGKIEFTHGGKVATEKGILIYTSPYNYEGFYTALSPKVDGVWVTQMENFVSVH